MIATTNLPKRLAFDLPAPRSRPTEELISHSVNAPLSAQASREFIRAPRVLRRFTSNIWEARAGRPGRHPTLEGDRPSIVKTIELSDQRTLQIRENSTLIFPRNIRQVENKNRSSRPQTQEQENSQVTSSLSEHKKCRNHHTAKSGQVRSGHGTLPFSEPQYI